MAADSMVQQARLRDKLLLILFIVAAGCSAPQRPLHSAGRLLIKQREDLKITSGLLMDNNQPFSGTVFTLFPGTKDTAELSSYLDGKEHGEWKKFYPSGKLKEKRSFAYGEKTGEYRAWWENGQQQLLYFFSAGEYEGTCSEWDPQGKLTQQMNYKNGHEEGHQQCWYDNGKIKANYIIRDGRRYGLLGTKNCINVSDSIFKN